MKDNLLIFGTANFNKSLIEVKESFNFSLIFFDVNNFLESSLSNINSLIVYSDICENEKILHLINKIKIKPLLLIKKHEDIHINNLIYNDKITLPLSISEFSTYITNFITSKKFDKNSSISIKEYIIDKNQRLLKKDNLSISITEREIQLIQLLFKEIEPLSKNIILKKVWKYAEGTDTHTIETHIYRLRKKILNKFNDDNFIINSKNGYSI